MLRISNFEFSFLQRHRRQSHCRGVGAGGLNHSGSDLGSEVQDFAVSIIVGFLGSGCQLVVGSGGFVPFGGGAVIYI